MVIFVWYGLVASTGWVLWYNTVLGDDCKLEGMKCAWFVTIVYYVVWFGVVWYSTLWLLDLVLEIVQLFAPQHNTNEDFDFACCLVWEDRLLGIFFPLFKVEFFYSLFQQQSGVMMNIRGHCMIMASGHQGH